MFEPCVTELGVLIVTVIAAETNGIPKTNNDVKANKVVNKILFRILLIIFTPYLAY